MEIQEMMRYAANTAYLYTALFLLLGTLGLPFPEEVILLLIGYLAGMGVVNVWLITPYASAVIIVLDNGMYYAARRLGRGFIKKWGRYILVSSSNLKKIEEFIDRHGNKTIFFSRFLLGFRSTGILLAGITKMPWKSFLLWDTLSIMVFLPITVGLGYFMHLNLNRFLKNYQIVKHVIFMGLLGLLFLWLTKQLISHYRSD